MDSVRGSVRNPPVLATAEEREESLHEFIVLLAAAVRTGAVSRKELEMLAGALEAMGAEVVLPWRQVGPRASLRIREPKKCGRTNCTKCPHGPYVILRREVDGRMKETQLGKLGSPRVDRKLRDLGLDLPVPDAASSRSTDDAPRPTLPRGFLHDD